MIHRSELAYTTCNTSSTNIKDVHLTVSRQPAEAAKTGYISLKETIFHGNIYMMSYQILMRT